ncbi:MAG TPA: tripartite tricarboxylate transporter substrate binding protein [Burkholderiales bacterium]|nr:tripartite tricarboxylate transporter substrate binding protein [Burkholderiales bacterium]
MRILLTLLALFAPLVFSGGAKAQAYPAKAIRFVVPFAPGGGNDILGRVVAQKLNEGFGVPVVVDNRGGAGGTIGTDIVAKSPPDGYTLLINNVSLAVNVTLYAKLPYDTLKDLEPVSLAGRQPNILVVHPSLPVKSVKELLALARGKPAALSFASGGIGSSSHLSAELLKYMTKVDIVHVPYKGMGPALIDLVSGQTQFAMATMASALPHIRNGRMRALAVSTAKRVAVVPDVPTMMEAGVRDFEYSTWYGILVPAGTPQPVIVRLSAELAKALSARDVAERFGAQGVEPVSTTPQEFKSFLVKEVKRWAPVIKAAGMQVN